MNRFHTLVVTPFNGLSQIGIMVLGVILELGGTVATIGGVLIGIKVVLASISGSPRGVAEHIGGLVGLCGGIWLMVYGARLAHSIYEFVTIR